MNPNLSAAEQVACLEVLYRGLLQIRLAANRGDTVRAEAIADALHNLPHLLSAGHERGWTIASFRMMFLTPLVERYPDVGGLAEPLELLR